MAEMSPAVAVTLSLGNSMCENSGLAAHVEIAKIKLATDAANLLSDSAKVISQESISCSYGNCEEDKDRVNMVVMSEGVGEGADSSKMLSENRNRSIATSESMAQESEEDEILSVDTNGIINEGLLVLNAGSDISLRNVEIESGRILAKAIILGESNIEQVPTAEVLITTVNPDAKLSDGFDLKTSEVVIQLPNEKNLNRGCRSVFELDCIPLWGSVSVIGKRTEMEDAVAVMPRFIKIPIKMLIGDRVFDGISRSLTDLTGHFFGVYDGHGGSQVANYCRDRIHVALAEEIGSIKDNLWDDTSKENRKAQWEKTFTSCFLKVDDEIGGKVSSGNEHTSGAGFEPIAPETVGSTAVVALVCSSHIVVANCGDSRAVLCRGKEALILSSDHKPNREDECARIEASGGKVIQWNGHRVFGVLGMSRSIGDRYLKPWIIPDPEVMFIPRAREDECLILASDGLWDVISSEEACEVARRRILLWHKKNGVPSLVERGKGVDPAAQSAADYLLMLAIQKGSRDNISVIVVDLKAQRKFKIKS
ncbi:Protein phosphatase 2C 16 [Hibiscus syriacus]|uniref:protein-serine/threonine phosphatase n=1 Tax=Hibiscus syriacus TaxID=106335 RepID=A0A6A3A8X3_HIBSY|nr:protein phosphatase 2C 16-like [Hibiscus syriacus]XP_039005887.1 protein phosphatase 2C 16-like [Hibiscus syriacus]KAE8699419.1 Protein phosphatase 2C 16 [Hibiscus syriacus]